jgi:hypothetical protein
MFFAHEKHQNGFTGNDIFNILSENLMLYPSKFLQRNVYINGYSSEIKIKYEYYSSRNLTDAEINLFNIIKDNFATFYGNYIEDLRITEEARKIAAVAHNLEMAIAALEADHEFLLKGGVVTAVFILNLVALSFIKTRFKYAAKLCQFGKKAQKY